MVLEVHGYLLSPPVLRVIACLKEKELDYQFIFVDRQAEDNKKEPFLRLNPFGQLPAFTDGDLTLFESRAITQYIVHAYADSGSQLAPEDPKAMAILSMWMEVEAHQFDVAASKLNYELVIKPMRNMTSDDKEVAGHEKALVKVLDVYEERLKVSQYLAGDDFTLVDLHHTPLIYFLMRTKSKALFEERTHVVAWVRKILTRSAWSKVQQLIPQNIVVPS
ncbi:unnamed protein product [Cuscuta europaea]|uniref:glutathione transferase n=1 Tax=Cuscuta europaea TaxID=41803 RepID=A0A9P0YXV2_CUSEU|nr:unnamed protein product [Cuscuta europaea]